ALQMVVCGGLIGLFCMFLGLRWQVAELIGMTLALSSTAIAMHPDSALNQQLCSIRTFRIAKCSALRIASATASGIRSTAVTSQS
ncbi:hypothetical protein MJM95_28095, partial [Salmonella enterica subsp. enterica serovar Anatum]|nr:hypothetical protein [Salmonella enterica subsp. enterica serovar Anatum]